MKHKLVYALAAPVLAIVVAVVVSSIALLAIGESPATAFRAMATSIDSAVDVGQAPAPAPDRRPDRIHDVRLSHVHVLSSGLAGQDDR